METITTNSWISFFVICVLFLAALFIAGYVIVKIGNWNAKRAKENEEHYNKMYANIQARILNRKPCNSDYKNLADKNYIRALISTLENLSYKNKEKTRVLWDNFNKEFNKKS